MLKENEKPSCTNNLLKIKKVQTCPEVSGIVPTTANQKKTVGFVGMSQQGGTFCPVLALGKIKNLWRDSRGTDPRGNARKWRTWDNSGEPWGCDSPAPGPRTTQLGTSHWPTWHLSQPNSSLPWSREVMRFIKMHISVIKNQSAHYHLVFNCDRAHWKNVRSSAEGLHTAG